LQHEFLYASVTEVDFGYAKSILSAVANNATT
jgi:hypothetical protein